MSEGPALKQWICDRCGKTVLVEGIYVTPERWRRITSRLLRSANPGATSRTDFVVGMEQVEIDVCETCAVVFANLTVVNVDLPKPDDAARWLWLASTLELQTKVFKYDFDVMSRDTSALASYLMWNFFAAHQELAEAAVEFSWAPWATDEPFVNRDRVRDELVDALHFIGNVLVALGVDDVELEMAYRSKQEKNTRRAASGTYSKRKGGLGDGSNVE